MLDIEMLPADHGDCLVVTYGTADRRRRVLIDGGTPGTFRRLKEYIRSLPVSQRHFELLIVTHIDADHIGGVLPLLRDRDLKVSFGDVWFNAWRHLTPPVGKGFLGPSQGDLLGNLLSQRNDLPWNAAFGGRTVVVPETGPLPGHTLKGGLRLTLLSPRWKELATLFDKWTDTAFRAGRYPEDVSLLGGLDGNEVEMLGRTSELTRLAARRFFPDPSAANGSSIAVLVEFERRRVLLAADAHAEVLIEGARRHPALRDGRALDAFKLPHHGSQKNINDELIQALPSQRYLVSTNGDQHNHPDAEAMARVFQHGSPNSTVHFNYDVPSTRTNLASVPRKERNRLVYPTGSETAVRIRLR